MVQSRIIVRGGHIVTMDPQLGSIAEGDILIEDGEIVSVAPLLPDVDAEVIDARGRIVAPGMIDTHRHTWQTQARAICADDSLSGYLGRIRFSASPAYTPEDVHLGNHLGALEAINAGVTTILDFSHCNNTPEHSDAAVTGLKDAGIRAVFGYGFFDSSPQQPEFFKAHADRIADFERLAGKYFPDDGGLLTLGVALNEIGLHYGLRFSQAEIEIARRYDALVVTHTGGVWSFPTAIAEIEAAGLLDAAQVHVHCNNLSDDDWSILGRHGCKVSISPETELNMGMGRLAFACERAGIKPTLSTDVMSLNSGDLFTQLRLALAFKRWADTEPLNLAGADPEHVTVSVREALEWVTVNGAEALRLEDKVGSIAVGKRADLMIVGGPGIAQHPIIDPLGTLVFQTTPSDVRTVLIDGKVVKRDGELVGVDVAALTARADASAEAILRRMRDRGDVPGMPPSGLNALRDFMLANMRDIDLAKVPVAR